MAAHIPRVYVDDALKTGCTISLNAEQQRHLVQVLRTTVGNPVVLFNGQGGEFNGTVTRAKKSHCDVLVGDYLETNGESPLNATLYLSILKRDAMNASLQRATELGVTRIVPTLSERVSVSAKQIAGRVDAWRTIVRQSAEQCGRTALPDIENQIPFADAVETDSSAVKLIAHGQSNSPWTDTPDNTTTVSIFVGPEGGFTDEEVDLAVANDCLAITFGPRILRAETAPATILGLAQQRWGDLSGRDL